MTREGLGRDITGNMRPHENYYLVPRELRSERNTYSVTVIRIIHIKLKAGEHSGKKALHREK